MLRLGRLGSFDREIIMLKRYRFLSLSALAVAFPTAKKASAAAVCIAFISATGCTPTMQHKADQSYLSLKKSLIESIQGKEIKPIAIPADALAARPASLDQLLHKVGRLAAKDNRTVEITSVDSDRNYLRKGVASGARESGKTVKIVMLNTSIRANTLIVLK